MATREQITEDVFRKRLISKPKKSIVYEAELNVGFLRNFIKNRKEDSFIKIKITKHEFCQEILITK
jgi:hypothetical protein